MKMSGANVSPAGRNKELTYRVLLSLALAAFTAVPMWSYVTKRDLSNTGAIVQVKWYGFPIRWQMNSVVPANVSGTRSQEAVVQTSFATWQAVSTANLSFTEGGPTDKKPGYDQVNLVTSNVTSGEY